MSCELNKVYEATYYFNDGTMYLERTAGKVYLKCYFAEKLAGFIRGRKRALTQLTSGLTR
jgi:hypothetical protein